MGAEFIGNFAETHIDTNDMQSYNKVRLLRHIILAHHGTLEFGSPVTPQCIEAYIVHYADALDATNEQILRADNGNDWTDKLWTLNNRPHLSHEYVKQLMEKENDEVTA
jgi:3'-5' exoribonuclease